jgi:hypothetical protein
MPAGDGLGVAWAELALAPRTDLILELLESSRAEPARRTPPPPPDH